MLAIVFFDSHMSMDPDSTSHSRTLVLIWKSLQLNWSAFVYLIDTNIVVYINQTYNVFFM